MAITWPTNVCWMPQPGTFTETPVPSKATYPVEAGPAKNRARTTALCFNNEWTIVLDNVSRQALLDFYRNDLKNGTLSWEKAHPYDGDVRSWQFADEPQFAAYSPKKFTAKLSLMQLP